MDVPGPTTHFSHKPITLRVYVGRDLICFSGLLTLKHIPKLYFQCLKGHVILLI